MIQSFMITGANTGIGKEVARQLAHLQSTEKIYLACRNEQKALHAKKELEKTTGRRIFDISLLDLRDNASVRRAVLSLQTPVDALIMNAGGSGENPLALTKEGTTEIFAINVLGHATLLEELLKSKKLHKTAVFVGSEAARGIPKMHMPKPSLKTASVPELDDIITGNYFSGIKPNMSLAYGQVKFIGTLWLSSMARKYPSVKMITMSPGSTRGTGTADNFPPFFKFMYKHLLMPIVFPMLGLAHKLQTGAARLVEGVTSPVFKTGLFYASKETTLTGPVIDQSIIFPDFKNEALQDNAYEAVSKYMRPSSAKTTIV